MPTITIPASEVRTGDVISLGGWPCTVKAVAQARQVGVTIYFHQAGVVYDIPADQMLTVDRPDPDAEVIEAMAQAIIADEGRSFVLAIPKCYYRAARACLAAYREHTQA